MAADKTIQDESFNKEEWIERKRKDRENAFQMIDDAIAELSDPNLFMQYLDVQSHFDRYSVNNALLVAYQMPDATRLADYAYWQEQGVYVNSGERAITILEPGKEYKREDGSVGVNYNTKKVFDISQTNAQQKPRTFRTNDRVLVKALVKTSPVPVEITDKLPDDVSAVYDSEKKTVFIRQGMSGGDIFRTLSKEIAFARMDSGDFSRDKCELQAYGVSFIVCARFGVSPPSLDKDERPFDGKDAKAIRRELAEIRKDANSMALSIEKTIGTRNKNKDAR